MHRNVVPLSEETMREEKEVYLEGTKRRNGDGDG